MSIRNLNYLFAPRSVALIGASERPRSVGSVVMQNLCAGDFSGPIFPVNPNYRSVAGVAAYANVDALPVTPDLAVICTPPVTVPGIVRSLAERGTKAAVVLTAGLSASPENGEDTLQQRMLNAARPHLMRILGPNCVGLILPKLGLNASFAHSSVIPGRIAFVSQSGALTTGILDWARTRGIGFSHFISLGDSADVDFGDVLDFLAGDPDTDAILLYIEAVAEARKFMSAARAAARNKPVIAVKAGRAPEGARAAASHTGALAAADDVTDAALRRAGVLRVNSIHDLYDAVETLARARPLRGDRLGILTNGGGPGVMAADALSIGGGKLAALSDHTTAALSKALPANWSHNNPVDIIGDAPPERYVKSAEILMEDAGVDAVLFIHAPTAIVPSVQIAEALTETFSRTARTVLACWLGGDGLKEARRKFSDVGIPTYETPENAVAAFLQLVNYRRNQELLLQTPDIRTISNKPGRSAVESDIRSALHEGREMLTEPEAKGVLAAFGIATVKTRTAATPEDAVQEARRLGYPVALKVLSQDISHKSDVGGVALGLGGDAEVLAAARDMNMQISKTHPEARLSGFTVQTMIRRSSAWELLVGAYVDPVYGPVIMFGQGGTAVEVIADRAVALPPLNSILADDLVSRTRIAKLLGGYRNRPAADMEAIHKVLLSVSQMLAEMPEIIELDINPLLADESGVIALDARVRVAEPSMKGTQRFAIRPYPSELEEWVDFGGERVLLRPIRPEDEPAHSAFLKNLSPEDIYFRFFGQVREMPHSQMARLTQIDYDREMVFVAIEQESKEKETLGVVRAVTDPDNEKAEFAIVVRSDLKGRGLGTRLLEKLIEYVRDRGTKAIFGEAMVTNERMFALAREFGFKSEISPDKGVVRLRLDLT